jgi:2'-5' RNA ligase
MKDAEKLYADMWRKSLHYFEEGRYEIDPIINDPNDMRRGLTLRAKLSPEILGEVEEYTKALKAFIPNQYFTPRSDLHLTVLTVVSCHSGFHHNPAMDDIYCEVISECMKDIPPPRITFRGLTASPSCLLLRGYPENNSLNELRDRLRVGLKKSGLPNSVDVRYFLKTAHATIMRFVVQNNAITEFTRFVKGSQKHTFGSQTIDQVEFVANDWCHKKTNTKVIRIFELNN